MITTYAVSCRPVLVIARHIMSGDLNVVSMASTWWTNAWFVPKSVMLPTAISVTWTAVMAVRTATAKRRPPNLARRPMIGIIWSDRGLVSVFCGITAFSRTSRASCRDSA